MKIFPGKIIRVMYTLCLYFLISHVLHSVFQPHHFTIEITNGLCLAKSKVCSSLLFTWSQQHLTLMVTFFVLELNFFTFFLGYLTPRELTLILSWILVFSYFFRFLIFLLSLKCYCLMLKPLPSSLIYVRLFTSWYYIILQPEMSFTALSPPWAPDQNIQLPACYLHLNE